MMAEHEIIVVGRDVGGGWTVRESSGVLLGRFISSVAANRFAFDEQHSRLDSSVALSDGVPTLRISGHPQSPTCFWQGTPASCAIVPPLGMPSTTSSARGGSSGSASSS